MKLVFITAFIALMAVLSASALNPDRTCPVNAACTLNFILLNTTGYQVGNAPCQYLILKSSDLSLDTNGTLPSVVSGGQPYYQLVHTFTVEDTYSMRIDCMLIEGVPAYFMQNIISSNYLNITAIPVNFTSNITIIEPNNNATLTVGSCPANTGASAMLWLVFAFALVLMWIGMNFKIGLIGVFGSLILGVASWYIYGCAPILGYIIGAASVISVAYFILIGWIM